MPGRCLPEPEPPDPENTKWPIQEIVSENMTAKMLCPLSSFEEAWPDQAAISKAMHNAGWHSPEPTTAPMLPIHKPVIQPPVYPPCSNPELEMQLRWKLLGCEENMRQRACPIVNKGLEPNVITHLPESSTASLLLTTKPTIPQGLAHHCMFTPA